MKESGIFKSREFENSPYKSGINKIVIPVHLESANPERGNLGIINKSAPIWKVVSWKENDHVQTIPSP